MPRQELPSHVRSRDRRRAAVGHDRMAGVHDELGLSVSAVRILQERYLRRDASGRITESTHDMMARVARTVAEAEGTYGPGSATGWQAAFEGMLCRLEFLPNSPTLMNAGTGPGLLSGCFVLPLEDSLESIFTTLTHTALVHQAGGGTGFSFSRLRPAGDIVASSHGIASGPVPFLRVFDTATDVIRQGGRRRGASMGALHVSHPDIEAFVAAKQEPGRLPNFNLSVAVTDVFMQAVLDGDDHDLINPRTGRVSATLSARRLFDHIVSCAWASGEPGLLLIDRINAANPIPSMGDVEATNPCGEVPLLPYESCNLGSINLARMLTPGGEVDWERLESVAALATRFLDDVIDVNRYPVAQMADAANATRKIGLGIMGLAELLATRGIRYDTEEATALAATIAQRINTVARQTSEQLARHRGPYPRWPDSLAAAAGHPPLRNAQRTAIAPAGTLSVIAGTTSGIEPMFAIAAERNVLGTRVVEVNPAFERTARQGGFWTDELARQISRTGRISQRPEVPDAARNVFVTALEISPRWHLRMQAAVQAHVDAAVSKSVNLPANATKDEVATLFLDAWRAGLKGVTVYRYGSRAGQVLRLAGEQAPNAPPPAATDADDADVCAGSCDD